MKLNAEAIICIAIVLFVFVIPCLCGNIELVSGGIYDILEDLSKINGTEFDKTQARVLGGLYALAVAGVMIALFLNHHNFLAIAVLLIAILVPDHYHGKLWTKVNEVEWERKHRKENGENTERN